MFEKGSVLFVLRLLIYTAIGAGAFELIVRTCTFGHVVGFSLDDGPLETAQFLVILSAGILLFALARGSKRYPMLLRVLGALALFAAARELDHFMHVHVGPRGYYLLTGPIGIYEGYLLWTGRDRLGPEIDAFIHSSAFALMFVGLFIVCVFAQIIGQEPLWNAVMHHTYVRETKDMVEETAEFLGYLFVFFGAIEAMVLDRGWGSGQPRSS